jgi:hypothetical protein
METFFRIFVNDILAILSESLCFSSIETVYGIYLQLYLKLIKNHPLSRYTHSDAMMGSGHALLSQVGGNAD